MKKIFVTRSWPEAVERELQSRYEVKLHNSSLSVAQWQQALEDYDAVCPCVADSLPAEIFTTDSPRAGLIANYGVGFNHIDTKAAALRGIRVSNTPGVLTDATADLAMTLMLMLARRAGEGERQLRQGQWQGWYPTHLMGNMVTGATLGIVGMGRIGKAMAHKAHYGFGMKILYHNRRKVDDADVLAMQAEYCEDLLELLRKSDFVSIHCPGGVDTHHMINAEKLSCMQPHAGLINTSRGDVIDESALLSALEQGLIGGAGLDVYENEPNVPEAFLQHENLVLLPHLGSATLETRTAMGMRVLRNLDAYFSGVELPDPVA